MPYMRGGRKRNRDLARAIVRTYLNSDVLSLAESKPYIEHLLIYEAQASAPIHECLKGLPNYHCSEYFDNFPIGSVHESGVRCENLEKLTFADESFDLVITQDVFEHITNPEKAFLEIKRVLKPGGNHIFTVPFHENKKTMTRIKVEEGKEKFLLPVVCHSDPLRDRAVVYTDFGEDMLDYLKTLGMPTEIVIHEKFYPSDIIPYISDRESYEQYLKFEEPREMLRYFFYNSVVFRSKKQKQNCVLPTISKQYLL